MEGSDSDKEEITFPHTFKHLSPRTHVTVTTHINLDKDDPIYIKTVYSPAKVYLDDELIYEFGRAENYPSYMKDPATEGYLIGTDGHSGDTELRIELSGSNYQKLSYGIFSYLRSIQILIFHSVKAE